MNNQLHFSSADSKWSTPQELFDKLNSQFHFTIDLAASAENTKCPIFFSEEQDSLAQDWDYHVGWLNPPYSRQLGKWLKKAYETGLAGGTVVMLLPARTDVKWFHQYVMKADKVIFLKGRLKFGDATSGAPFPSMIVIFRPSI